MRRFPFVLLPAIGILVAPLGSSASTVTGSSATEVSTRVDGSLAGQSSVPDQNPAAQGTTEPVMAGGMAISDLSGLPFMLVGPPTSYAMAPHNKLRSLTGEVAADNGGGGGGGSNMNYQAGNGNGGTASLGSVASAPQAIPEPFTVLLAAPALALALRRRLRRS